jgi:hypothetical protein
MTDPTKNDNSAGLEPVETQVPAPGCRSCSWDRVRPGTFMVEVRIAGDSAGRVGAGMSLDITVRREPMYNS